MVSVFKEEHDRGVRRGIVIGLVIGAGLLLLAQWLAG